MSDLTCWLSFSTSRTMLLPPPRGSLKIRVSRGLLESRHISRTATGSLIEAVADAWIKLVAIH